MSDVTTASQLGAIIHALEQERNSILVLGRPLTPEEQNLVQRLDLAIPHLESAIAHLEGAGLVETPPDGGAPVPSPPLLDGRYEGGNPDLFVELRVDAGGSGVISADIFRVGPTGRTYAASVRSDPGVRIAAEAGSWGIVGSDIEDRTTRGVLTLAPQPPDGQSLTGSLEFETAMGGLPVQVGILFAANRVSEGLRTLGIEIEREADVDPIAAFDFEGRSVTIQSALHDAGFDVSDVGEASVIPTPTAKWGTAQLHALMQDFAQATLTKPLWELHLLLLAESSRDGLFGVMFDSSDSLPRQGSAVFATEIQGRVSSSHFPRKLIQTTVHELGHALNLAHRFEREVGRADSTSFMNYDWRYKGGGHFTEFWSRFAFTFDDDELEFLRHAPRRAVIPGGAAFRSVNYWSDGNGGYSPYVPEVPLSILSLTLQPPASGPVFTFAQPVFLEVTLTNESDQALNLQRWWLDPKASLLELVIRRRGSDDADVAPFRPIMTRCFEPNSSTAEVVPPGQSISENLNLTFGSAGFPFAEPGEYDVTALLVFFDQDSERDFIARSNTLKVRIGYPQGAGDEEDALTLFRNDVGAYFALGGVSSLPEAADALRELCDRRQGAAESITDPIVAAIVRCQGIDAGRWYMRYQDGEYRRYDGDRAKAAELLERLSQKTLRACFDPTTAYHTERLGQRHREAVQES